MTGRFKYEKRYWYDHMRDEDRAIWERFIEKFPDAFETVSYDVAVGSPPDFSTVVSPATGGDTLRIYKKKIDVVAFKGAKTTLVELKPRAGAGALGQVLGYKKLYLRDIDPAADVECWVITDEIIPDIEEIADDMGVLIKVA